MKHLLFFIGTDCPHCEAMKPLVEKLEREMGITLHVQDIWVDKASEKLLDGYRTPDCDGLPYFYNTETGVSLCGEVSYKLLLAWAMGGNVSQ